MILSHPASLKQEVFLTDSTTGMENSRGAPSGVWQWRLCSHLRHWAAEADGNPSYGPAASHMHPRLHSEAAAEKKKKAPKLNDRDATG